MGLSPSVPWFEQLSAIVSALTHGALLTGRDLVIGKFLDVQCLYQKITHFLKTRLQIFISLTALK